MGCDGRASFKEERMRPEGGKGCACGKAHGDKERDQRALQMAETGTLQMADRTGAKIVRKQQLQASTESRGGCRRCGVR